MNEPTFPVKGTFGSASTEPDLSNSAFIDQSMDFISEAPEILAMLPVGLHIEDSDLRSVFVNDSFVKIFGYTLSEIASPDDWWSRAYPDPLYRDLVQRQWFEAVALANANKCEINPQEWVVTCKGGEQKVIQFHLRRVGNVHVHVYLDVTARHRLEAELRRLANTDALTGVANRRRFFEVAATVMDTGGPLAVLVFDLDGFKAVNDGYGHAVGDQVLVDVARLCRSVLDEEQLLARLGGEEFGVLLPGCDQAAAAAVAERLRAAVARAPVRIAATLLPVTVSIGVACGLAEDGGIDGLLVRADRALYAAKHAGRNRVCFAPASDNPATAADVQYNDPRLVALYEQINTASHDFRFYGARIGTRPLRVLDLGCGTGLFARQLADQGHRVTGLDPAAAMIRWARAQDAAQRIGWHVGRIDDLPPETRFDVVVMTGHAFQCLTSEDAVRATMAGVRARLAPGGRFMFESRNPLARAWERWTPDDVDVVQDAAGHPVRVFTEVLSVDGRLVTFRNHFAFPDGELLSDSTLLFLSRPEIERHLSEAGFTAVDVFGDWSGGPATDASPEIIVIAA